MFCAPGRRGGGCSRGRHARQRARAHHALRHRPCEDLPLDSPPQHARMAWVGFIPSTGTNLGLIFHNLGFYMHNLLACFPACFSPTIEDSRIRGFWLRFRREQWPRWTRTRIALGWGKYGGALRIISFMRVSLEIYTSRTTHIKTLLFYIYKSFVYLIVNTLKTPLTEQENFLIMGLV